MREITEATEFRVRSLRNSVQRGDYRFVATAILVIEDHIRERIDNGVNPSDPSDCMEHPRVTVPAADLEPVRIGIEDALRQYRVKGWGAAYNADGDLVLW